MEIPDAWHGLAGGIRDASPSGAPDTPVRIVVAGPSDAGKTTLSAFLGRTFAADAPAARVDCDPGQSTVGIPGTLGLVSEPWKEGDAVGARRFVGDVSPAGHFLQTLTGIVRLAERAEERGARTVVFDSSGYMDTAGGREFHHQVVDVLDPDHLVALQRGGELTPLLRPFRRRRRPTVHELEVPAAVERRTPAQRRAYRNRRLREHFRDTGRHRMDLGRIGYHGHVPDLNDPEACRNRLVGVLDREGFLLATGAVREVEGRELVVRAPDFDPGRAASVQFGSLRVDVLCGV